MNLHDLQRELFGGSRLIVGPRGPELAIGFSKLKAAIVKSGMLAAGFDERWYLHAYPEVAALVSAGAFQTAFQHFEMDGFWSGRLGTPPQIDETFYLSHYTDIASAVSAGRVPNATEHFIRFGFCEGRAANATLLVDKDWYTRTYPFAAWQVKLGKFATLQQYFNSEGLACGHFANAAAEASLREVTRPT